MAAVETGSTTVEARAAVEMEPTKVEVRVCAADLPEEAVDRTAVSVPSVQAAVGSECVVTGS